MYSLSFVLLEEFSSVIPSIRDTALIWEILRD